MVWGASTRSGGYGAGVPSSGVFGDPVIPIISWTFVGRAMTSYEGEFLRYTI